MRASRVSPLFLYCCMRLKMMKQRQKKTIMRVKERTARRKAWVMEFSSLELEPDPEAPPPEDVLHCTLGPKHTPSQSMSTLGILPLEPPLHLPQRSLLAMPMGTPMQSVRRGEAFGGEHPPLTPHREAKLMLEQKQAGMGFAEVG